MSTFLKIVLVEPSLILRSGMSYVLRRLTTFDVQVVETGETEQLEELIAEAAPDVLIINPSLTDEEMLRELQQKSLRLIAFQSALADARLMQRFDAVVSIYDTAEQIKESGAGTILDFIARMPGMSVVGRQVSYRGYRPGFMVDGRLEETVGEMNPVRAFRSTGMGRNHKTQTRLPPIPDPGGWIDFTGMNYSNTNSAQQSTGGNKRQIQYIDDFDNVPDILYYPLEIVSRIDLIEGGNMVLWGVSHWKQAGIISITTKKGKELDDATRTLPARDVEFVSPLGYQTPAEFYAPAYATEKARRSMVPDYRTTLYWNPTVKLDDTGQATVEFYTSDAPADYDITIEGITQTGKIVRTVKIITE